MLGWMSGEDGRVKVAVYRPFRFDKQVSDGDECLTAFIKQRRRVAWDVTFPNPLPDRLSLSDYIVTDLTVGVMDRCPLVDLDMGDFLRGPAGCQPGLDGDAKSGDMEPVCPMGIVVTGGLLLDAMHEVVQVGRRLGLDQVQVYRDALLARAVLPVNLAGLLAQLSPALPAHWSVLAFLFKDWGVPLYLVPRASVAKCLLGAASYKECQEILVSFEREIVEDCAEVLSSVVPYGWLEDAKVLIGHGVGAIRGGHYAVAQALLTNVLDTLVRRFFPRGDDRKSVVGRDTDGRVQVPGLNVVDLMVWTPVQGAHKMYRSGGVAEAPGWVYSRHRTTHDASVAQYTRANAIQVLMLATSVAGFASRSLPLQCNLSWEGECIEVPFAPSVLQCGVRAPDYYLGLRDPVRGGELMCWVEANPDAPPPGVATITIVD